mgnify:CR=1 FL=1
MDQLECITKSLHRKGAHLTFEERVIIQTRLRDGWSPQGDRLCAQHRAQRDQAWQGSALQRETRRIPRRERTGYIRSKS